YIPATEVVSAGLLRKAIPSPSASSSGKTKTQKMISGSRFSSSIRAQSKCQKPAQRPLRKAGACGGLGSSTLGVVGSVIAIESSTNCQKCRNCQTSPKLIFTASGLLNSS